MMRFRRPTLTTLLTLLSAATVLAMAGTFALFTRQMLDSFAQKTGEYIDSVIGQYRQSLGNRIQTINHFLVATSMDPNLHDFIRAPDIAERLRANAAYNANLMAYQGFIDGIFETIVYSQRNNSFRLPFDAENRQRVIDFAATVGDRIRYSGLTSFSYNSRPGFYLLAGAPMPQDADDPTAKDVIILVLDSATFLPDVANLPFAGVWSYYVTDRGGTVITTNDQASSFRAIDLGGAGEYRVGQPFPPLFGGPSNVMAVTDLPEIGGKLVVAVPKATIYQSSLRILTDTLIFFALMAALMAAGFMVVIRMVAGSNRRLLRYISDIRDKGIEQLDTEIRLYGYREAEVLAEAFNALNQDIIRMTGQLVQRETALYQSELRAATAEKEFLMSQINPHFLYNCFETVYGLAALAGQERIMLISEAISRIFRYSIKARDEVPLKEELTVVRSYLSIQGIRFNNRFAASFELDPAVDACLIPKMVVQPLVENAIIHGLEGREADGQLRIRTGVFDGRLEIAVSDNGPGIPPAKLADLLAGLDGAAAAASQDKRSHIGLRNIQERIRLLHGPGYGLGIESGPAGTLVRLRLPLKEEP